MVEINVSSPISSCNVITKYPILTIVEVMSESELTSGLWLIAGKWKTVKLGSVSLFTLLSCLTKANSFAEHTYQNYDFRLVSGCHVYFMDFKWFAKY